MSLINPHIKSRLQSDALQLKPVEYYVDGITKNRDHYILSEAITILESEQEEHRRLALKILTSCYPHRSASFRFGVTGSPGVGKSTFIDSIVSDFLKENSSIGVLTIDPSSIDGKGSILGDKTRMNELSKNDKVFIRPSPSNRHLGGLNQFTFEAITLCEAAGMDRIFIETVGVGQSEVDVSRHTDATILLVLPGSGDSLQGIKKGIFEKADLVVINKSDGETGELAKSSARDFRYALHLNKDNPNVPILNYSSLTKENKHLLLAEMQKMMNSRKSNLSSLRALQEKAWLKNMIIETTKRVVTKQLAELDIETLIDERKHGESPFSSLAFFHDHLDINVRFKK